MKFRGKCLAALSVQPLFIDIEIILEDIYDAFEVCGAYFGPIGDGSPTQARCMTLKVMM